MGDESELELYVSYHWETPKADIRKSISISLEDSFYGKQIQIHTERTVRNQHCHILPCHYCDGAGVLKTETKNTDFHQTIQSPCPMCLGLKFAADNCPLFSVVHEVITIDIPVGCIPGYHVSLKDKGNEVLIPGKGIFKNGQLYIDILDVSTGPFNVTSRGLELTVFMSPSEALKGFNRSYEIIPGRILEINRINKTTFPETEVIIQGQGLPIPNEVNKSGHLYVLFEFEKDDHNDMNDDNDGDGEGEGGELIALDEDIVIQSQQEYESKKKIRETRRHDKIIKRILLSMKREMDRETQRRRERQEREEERMRNNQQNKTKDKRMNEEEGVSEQQSNDETKVEYEVPI